MFRARLRTTQRVRLINISFEARSMFHTGFRRANDLLRDGRALITRRVSGVNGPLDDCNEGRLATSGVSVLTLAALRLD